MQGFAIDLGDMLRNANQRPEQPSVAKPIPEAQVAGIQEVAKGYHANPFKVGDLVTPRATSILVGKGSPFQVIESLKPEDVANMWEIQSGGTAHPDFGAKFNLRVMGYAEDGQSIVAWWNEAYNYEPWFPKAAPAGEKTN